MPIGQKRCQTDTEAVFKKPSKKWVLSTAENRAYSRSAAEFEKQMLVEQRIRFVAQELSRSRLAHARDRDFLSRLRTAQTSIQILAPDPCPCVLSGLK